MAIAESSPYRDLIPSPEKSTKLGITFGSYSPERTLTNQEIESWEIKTEGGRPLTADAILHKTGIEQRYVAND
ncbi:MAG: hypothetical protein U1E54_02960, partial [Candidatus Levybacteria bacterium]|nr:hypothetical protein [Candidatus Levybacteria bacterium]